jgi:glycosyltransferase involved in cell wall biosynthesis
MKDTFFSVIIPTLNEDKFLPKLLKDIKRQTYGSFEVIVVDGRSTDKTVAVAEKHGRSLKDFKLIKSRRRNVSHQRNLGAEIAKGSYLVFLDADVQLLPNYLTEVNKEIKKSGAAFITTYHLPDTDNPMDVFHIQMANFSMEMMLALRKQLALGFNFIIQKKLFFEVGRFDEEATFGEDHELSIRVYKKKGIRMKIIKKPLLKWSLRRFRKDGRIPLAIKYLYSSLYIFFFDKITDKDFGYPMGGDNFKDMKKMNKKSIEDTFSELVRKIFEE